MRDRHVVDVRYLLNACTDKCVNKYTYKYTYKYTTIPFWLKPMSQVARVKLWDTSARLYKGGRMRDRHVADVQYLLHACIAKCTLYVLCTIPTHVYTSHRHGEHSSPVTTKTWCPTMHCHRLYSTGPQQSYFSISSNIASHISHLIAEKHIF